MRARYAPSVKKSSDMFTGIVEGKAKVVEFKRLSGGARVTYDFCEDIGLKIGQSVCVDGACLTVEGVEGRFATFFLSDETLQVTKFSRVLKEGYVSNYERALRLGDRLDGHLVLGHVDCVARVLSVNSDEWEVEIPPDFTKYVVYKGSVALDGVSLTVNSIRGTKLSFRLIPHTLEVTAFSERSEGDLLNLEVDILAKYLERLSQPLLKPHPSGP